MPTKAPAPPAIDEVVARFLVALRSRGLSARTVRNYYQYPLARVLTEWCAEHGVTSLEELSGPRVDQLVADVYDRKSRGDQPISRATALAYLKAVRHFLAWTAQEGGEKLAERIRLPRPKSKAVETLTPHEIDMLEDACRTERDRLIIRLLAETGARESEIVGIKRSDLIERDRRYFFVRVEGKTGQRMPPVTPALFRRLREYADGKSRPKSSHPELFLASRAKAGQRHEPLTAAGVYQVVKKAAEAAELDKRVYVHLFRHSMITRMVAAGTHPAQLSDMTGVSVAVIARHYSHTTMEQNWEAMMKVLKA